MAAYTKHELNSSVGFNGICRKISMFCLVGVAHIIDLYMLGDTAMLKTSVTLFYAVNEGISIFENVDVLGIPIPQFLKERLFNLKEQMTSKEQMPHRSNRSKGAKESKERLATSKGKQKQGLKETQVLPQEASKELQKGLLDAIVGHDISGHEVIRHELYAVHNGSMSSHVADNAAREDSGEASDDSGNDSDSDSKDSEDDKDADEDDRCLGKSDISDIEDSGNGNNGAGE